MIETNKQKIVDIINPMLTKRQLIGANTVNNYGSMWKEDFIKLLSILKEI